jgi:hypothetical protein
MNKNNLFSKMQCLVVLLVAFVAGCASNGAEIPLIAADTTAPTVSFTAPVNGQTAVPYDRKVSVAFSEAMNPATITAATFTVAVKGGALVPGVVTPVGTSATFTPSSSLAASTTYIATITPGPKDLAGNALIMTAACVWEFTTSAIADTIKPTVSFTAPITGQTAVPTNRILHAAFSEVMDPLTLTAANFTVTGPGGVGIAGAVAAFGTSATFTPTSALANSSLYTATIKTGVMDLAGNTMANDFVFTFTTGAAADTTRPTVSVTSPTNAQIAVPGNRMVAVGFSEVMDPASITTATFTVTGPGATPVTGLVVPTGTSAAFTPIVNLAFNTLYTATIKSGSKDLAGNTMANDFVFTFTTGAAADTTRPTVSVTSPTNTQIAVPGNRMIAVGFSEVMDPASITTATFTLTGPGATPVTGLVVPTGTSAVFTPIVTLAFNTLYTATIKSGSMDLAGNTMANDFVFTFTTGAAADTTRPTVSVTSPTNTQIAVPGNRIVTVGFSEVMDPASITTATFTLAGPGATPVAGTVVPTGTTAVFMPIVTLAFNTLYTATIKSGSMDLAGNTMANDFVFTFTTGAVPDTTKPFVIATINANGAVNVPTNTKVGATFSEVMDPLTITSATFSFKQGATDVPGTVAYSGVNVVFTPTNILAANTNYTATITTGAKDLAGNSLASNYVWSFTTAAVADVIKPTVILVSPLDLATNVATNSAVHATFSKDMDPLTISTATFTLTGTTPVTGTVDYNATNRIATFTPLANLAVSTTYTATVTTGAKDLTGNALAIDKVWSFTTAAAIVPQPVSHLGSTGTFGLMATAAITSTGNSVINGDVSLEPGTSMTGFPPAVVNGSIHINDTVSAKARADLLIAYSYYKGLPPGIGPNSLSASADPGALFPLGVPPGTYTSGSTIVATTPMILDAGGDANAIWVFQIGSSLTTGASVTLANGAQAKNVFWVPTWDATIGVGTIFYGTIVSGRDVTAVTGATINGRILAGATTAGTLALQNAIINVPAP